MKQEISKERLEANALIASLHKASKSNIAKSDVAKIVRKNKNAKIEDKKSTTTDVNAVNTTNSTFKLRKDVKNFTTISTNLIRYNDEKDMSSYAKRLYLKQSHNNSALQTDVQERALSTFYRDTENKLQTYNRASAYKLVKEYIAKAQAAKQEFIVTREVEKFYRVFGPAISDNTLAIFRKLHKELNLRLEAIKDSEASKRVKYYKLYVS